MDHASQSDQILKHLRSGKTLTAIEALQRFSCLRLAARVKNLRDEGHAITSQMVDLPNGKRVAKYQMVNEAPAMR